MTRMVITLEVNSGAIVKVEKIQDGGPPVQIQPGQPPVPVPPNRRVIGTLFAHRGSDCITLDIGGASFQICV